MTKAENGEFNQTKEVTEILEEGGIQNEILTGEPGAEEAPKRRGRKRKNPAEVTEKGDVTEPKKRGRKGKRIEINPEQMAKKIQLFHNFLFRAIGCPEMALDETESQTMAQAASDFSEEFGLTISNRILVITNLIGACATIYGPRVIIFRMKAQAKAAEQKRREMEGVQEQDGIPTDIAR
jgi:hypothetical protein